jgi:hypothetical protein
VGPRRDRRREEKKSRPARIGTGDPAPAVIGETEKEGNDERALKEIRFARNGRAMSLSRLLLGTVLRGGEKRKHQVEDAARAYDLSALLLKETDHPSSLRGKAGFGRGEALRKTGAWRRGRPVLP